MAKLFFYYSTMNAGKSTSLLQAAYNYAERGMATKLYTAKLGDRAQGRIASRIGLAMDATLFDASTDFVAECRQIDVACLLIDEAQFLTKSQVRQLATIVDESNVPVMCYGIRTDFLGDLFEGSAALLAWADTLTELKTICGCGRKATMVVRLSADGRVERDGDQVEVGGNERYLPLCRRHFTRAIASGHCDGWK
jgi:thymidine kinase